MQAAFLNNLVVPVAKSYGLEAEYAYLRPSIKAFPTGRWACADRPALAAFVGEVCWLPLLLGTCIVWAVKGEPMQFGGRISLERSH